MSNIPNTFTSGTKAKASEVNANFVYVENELINERTSLNGDYEVLSGCLVTVNDPEDTDINIASGKVLINGLVVSVAEQLDETLSAADGSNPRYDVICVDDTGVISIIEGTPGATPFVPTLTADKCPLATILRPAGVNNALGANLYEGRYFRNKPYISRISTFQRIGADSVAEWPASLSKTIIIPPFVTKRFIKAEFDYDRYYSSGNMGTSSYSELRNCIRLEVNGAVIETFSTYLIYYRDTTERSFTSSSGGYNTTYFTSDDLDFNQFNTLGIRLYNEGGSSNTPRNRTYNINTLFLCLGE
jgi:hypothetical protein